MHPVCRYKQIRSPGWALYLHSFSWGIIFCFFPFLVLSFYKIDPLFNKFGMNANFAGISFDFLAWALLSISSSFICGWMYRRSENSCNDALEKCASENDLKQYILGAAKSGELVQISLSSRKVYIGFIVKINHEDMLHNSEYISFWPTLSGYRTEKTLSLKITNNYQQLYDSIMMDVINKQTKNTCSWTDILNQDEASEEERIETMFRMISKYLIVIPSSEIIHIGHFDIDAYKKINQNIHHKKSSVKI